MPTILALLGLILGAWSVRSICIKQQSNSNKFFKSLLAGFYFLATGGSAANDDNQFPAIIIMLIIGGVIQLYCNYRYIEPKESYIDAANGHKNSLGFFNDQVQDEAQQSYRSKNYAKASKSKGLNDVAFNYVNAEGVSRFREVDVKSFDGQYLEGYCHAARKFRTFRLDRIEGDIILRGTGQSMDPYEWATEIEA
ncbi:WYL domain-containing protein [Erwinia sp. HDF1-3R]|uniref:WYL domain-containing protein n=1 Tax=Erwinia sp. HDF1-3R TaxID=3141543 RepID=UPI0031F504D1